MKPAHPFYMIRHGETDWNREQRFQGQMDIPVNPTGLAQAAAYADMLRAERDDWSGWYFVASPLSRTRTTMEVLREGLGMAPGDYALDDDLKEVTFGDWEGHTLEALRDEVPHLVAAREADKWNFVAPGGESYAIAVDRVRRFLERLQGPSLIVTHGGIIRGTRHLLEAIEGDSAARGRIPQDNIYRFDGNRGRWLR
ncbi:MAG: histidine phosphatase family protein [Roseitalea sp.]|nr:histidine phosphatase family protein [Roseitalea sp.]MBO6953189.1 histidine phosphatase family protein [Rhizobiaceae bacterium]MBO6593536.1 histidine phosphatase family protein [Roseitalea sp.]MBO6600932.1 histidine phosphatase family protein [Roseitalea sp.]MBO6612613.1 histidine phosphatase family protein [Roseitalea sp.]